MKIFSFLANLLQKGFAKFTNIRLVHGATIDWDKTVGVSGGGITLTVDGMNTVTDAGAAGIPAISIDSANNIVYLGNTSNSFSVQSGAAAIATGGATRLFFTNTLNQIIGNPTVADSWLLAKGVHGSRNLEDTPPVTEIPAVGGSIAWIAGRGGIKRFTAVIAGDDSLQHNNSCDWISLQDFPRKFMRFAAQQWNAGVPDSFQCVGWRDWVNNNCIWIQWDAAVAGGNITIRANRGGATTIHDTGIPAVAGAFSVWEMITNSTGTVTIYRNGTLVHTLTAVECPVNTTLMEDWVDSACVAPAILSQLDIDVAYTVLSRNVGATP